jgi:SAM-dependent methyltransferase
MSSPRRLVFGAVADLYDRHRPGYPPALIDDVVADAGVAPGERVLEVGAGTGKATEALLARGLDVVAVEPSREMADALRQRPGAEQVQIVLSDFEHAELGGETFGLLLSAQAWHWVDPATGYMRARSALRPGGLLALVWNRVAWPPEHPLRRALTATYERVVPDLANDGPMHPAYPGSSADPDWTAEIALQPGFGQAQVRYYPWSIDYTAETYPALLATLSELRLLDAPVRQRLLDAVAQTVDEHGGSFTMPMRTRLCTARVAAG